MNRQALLLTVVFFESLATIFTERGFYFYVEDRLGAGESARLGMALVFGLTYVAGALASHGLAARLTERRAVLLAVLGQAVGHALLALAATPWSVWVLFPAVAFFTGLKWPIIESYVSAGLPPRQQARAIGIFSIGWSTAVPVSLAVTGPLLAWRPEAIFLIAVAINLWAMAMLRRLDARPLHLADDHPLRLPPEQVVHFARLTAASRWALFGSYAMLFLMAPLMPTVLHRLGWSIQAATGLSGVMDVFRVAAFVLLQWTVFWHGRRDFAALCIVLVPVGMVLVLLGPTTGVMVAGQVIFGLSAGAIYYAALYYGMLERNSAVDAGGWHEAVIGMGFAIGPLGGLAGIWLVERTGDIVTANLIGLAPVAVLTTCVALYLVLRAGRMTGALPE